MEELLKFLEENPFFYLATEDDDQPRVRPFGFHMLFDDKLYFVSATMKNVYKQMAKNPKVEICAMSKKMQFLRITGEVVFDNDNMAAKTKVFEVMPDLLPLYKSAENPYMSVFYLKNMTATIASLTDAPRNIL